MTKYRDFKYVTLPDGRRSHMKSIRMWTFDRRRVGYAYNVKPPKRYDGPIVCYTASDIRIMYQRARLPSPI